MFSKDSKNRGDGSDAPFASGGSARSTGGTPSIISADLEITGNLKSNGDIQIDGKINGDVNSSSAIIGENAEVNGTISCDRVKVCGKVSGEIKAGSVVLARSARVKGDVAHNSLEIEAGASLEGGVRQLDSKPSPTAESKDKPAKATVSSISEAPSGGSSSLAGNGTAAAV